MIRAAMVAGVLCGLAGGQTPAGVRFDERGWPIVPGDPGPPAAATQPATGEARSVAPPAAAPAPPPPASGMALGSPLLEVFQQVRSPGAFHELGGLMVHWRLTVFGPSGEPIGTRFLTHTADCGFAARDRLEHGDGRVFARLDALVAAERQGLPWPTLAEAAGDELELFGVHLRAPWCFADQALFAVIARDTVDRRGTRLARIIVERRPPAELDLVGPEAEPRPRDRFELLYEPSSGLPRELMHRFARSRETRRVLLEDWRDIGGVRLAHRRIYVDDALRPTTTLEITRIERTRVAERQFRLL